MTKPSDNTTISDLVYSSELNKEAIVVPGINTITYGNLLYQVESLKNDLISIGITKRDRIAIVLPNSIEFIVTFLAVSAVATVAPLNPLYKSEEFEFYIKDINAKALITTKASNGELDDLDIDGLSSMTVSIDANGKLVLGRLNRVQQSGINGSNEIIQGNTALILHTSGTTSRPKRVPLTHANIISSTNHIIDTYSLSHRDVSLCVMPLFHVHGLVASTLATLSSGGTLILPERLNIASFWGTVTKYNVTWFSAVPTIHQALIGRRRQNKALSRPDGLRFIRSCSAPLANQTLIDMEELFGVPVLEAYGMTEAAHQMTSNPLPPDRRMIGSVGKATGLSVAIMDDKGNFIATGSPGEIVIKGPNVIDGYEGNPEVNVTSFSSGWFRTGDEGILDEDGYLTITGRLKEFINRSGEKISPKEIDEILLRYPGVKEAVAFGVPNEVHGEVPAAVVVADDTIRESDLVEHCRNHMAIFKCPRKIYIVSSIPKTATGKVQRRIVASKITELYK